FLLIVFPLWYRIRWTIKTSLLVCVMVWILALVPFLLLVFSPDFEVTFPIVGTVFLLPCPLLIFFLGGTLRALSASVSVPADEKRRVVGMLVLVLLIYTLLFLPVAIFFLVPEHSIDRGLCIMIEISLHMSPFANLVLYIIMRKGVVDKLLASVCCCKVANNDVNGPAV
ncbi:mas-related G-protein coupled receptor member B1-like, partial [Plectropomus leopardus]|uniref:mas-related G-protein coupled receptor member B1-like n=1 Tax=Plectropomus leopardus TaxID=160734 RepID=UPI001C4CFE9C